MAGASNRKKKFVVRLELGAKGLFASGVVCFCVLLWMFLLGIWAGDHLAAPDKGDIGPAPVVKPIPLPFESAGAGETSSPPPVREVRHGALIKPQAIPYAPQRDNKKKIAPRAAKKVRKEKKKVSRPAVSGKATAGGSFFTLQVGAYKEKTHAIEEIARLKARDLAAFYRTPEKGRGKFVRVYVGQYPTMAAARAAGAEMEKGQSVKSFVVMIPGKGGGR